MFLDISVYVFHSCTWGVVRCMNWLHPRCMNIIASHNVWVLKKYKPLVAQLCLTLCDPMDYSPPGSSSMGFSRQEYWSGLLFPSSGDLPNPGIEARSPTLQADTLPSEPPGKPMDLSVPSVLFLFLLLRPYASILVNCFHDTAVKSACVWSLYEQCCAISI